MTIQLIQFNKTSLPSINDSSLAVSPEGEISYTKEMTSDCWNPEELALFSALAETFNTKCSHFGVISIQDAVFKSFTYPGVSKNADGVVGLQLGDQWISPLTQGETPQLDKSGNPVLDKKSGEPKTIPAWFLAGIRVFFGEGSYKNPSNPEEVLYYPSLEIRSGDTVFQIQCQVNQKPHDVSKRKPDVGYFDQTAFKSALDNHDEETVFNTITSRRSGYGKTSSISYFLSDVFEKKAFPPGGVVIPVTGYTRLTSDDPKLGDSIALQIDLAAAWFPATGTVIQGFEVPVKVEGEFQNFDSSEVDGLYLSKNHQAFLNITALEKTGKTPSVSAPWFLRITAPNKTGNFKHVPEHCLYELAIAQRIPALKGTFPAQFALPGAAPALPF